MAAEGAEASRMSDAPWLIVGLGNPGKTYALTRHNIGFMLLDALAKKLGASWNEAHQGHWAEARMDGVRVGLLKPQTFMNKSGFSVQAAQSFWKIPLNRLVVVHDEIDLAFGLLRIQQNRGHGGHNGIRSIHEQLGSPDYVRLRMGVGRPADPRFNTADYVLGRFSDAEEQQLPNFLSTGLESLQCLITEGIGKASTKFNALISTK